MFSFNNNRNISSNSSNSNCLLTTWIIAVINISSNNNKGGESKNLLLVPHVPLEAVPLFPTIWALIIYINNNSNNSSKIIRFLPGLNLSSNNNNNKIRINLSSILKINSSNNNKCMRGRDQVLWLWFRICSINSSSRYSRKNSSSSFNNNSKNNNYNNNNSSSKRERDSIWEDRVWYKLQCSRNSRKILRKNSNNNIWGLRTLWTTRMKKIIRCKNSWIWTWRFRSLRTIFATRIRRRSKGR